MEDCWRGPTTSASPKLWKSFENINPNTGIVEKFQIQEIVEEDYELLVQIVAQHLRIFEPIRICTKFSSDPTSVTEEVEILRRVLKQGLSFICWTKNEFSARRFVGVSIIRRCTQNETQHTFRGDILKNIESMINYVINKNNYYQQFNVTEVIWGIAAFIISEYNVPDICANMLECSEKLCKSIGIKVMFSVITSEETQQLLASAGVKVYAEMTYEELAKLDPKFVLPGIQEYGRSIQLMYNSYE